MEQGGRIARGHSWISVEEEFQRRSTLDFRREERRGRWAVCDLLCVSREERRSPPIPSFPSFPSSTSPSPCQHPRQSPTSVNSSHPAPAESSSTFPSSFSLFYGARDERWRLFERTMGRRDLLRRFHLALYTPLDSRSYTRWVDERRR